MNAPTPLPDKPSPAGGGTSRRQAEPVVRFRYPVPDAQAPHVWSRIFPGLPNGVRFCIVYSPTGDRYEVQRWGESLGVRPRAYGMRHFPVLVLWGSRLRECGFGVDAVTFLQDVGRWENGLPPVAAEVVAERRAARRRTA